ncbi:unnamed protein product [Rotaria sp. Silwood1]|nr:unnamed protein product [Rotaria sp. Silwood1]
MPVNGWWHEWTFNYDCKVDYNEVHLDLAEREAKILVWLGEDWQPPAPQPEPPTEPAPNNDTNMTKANREENQQY